MNRKWIALSLVIGMMATTGFAKDISPVTVTTSNMDTSASTIGSDQQYRLRQGDELMIDVVQQADLGANKTFTIRPDGYVSIPMVGNIKADGMTVDEFTRNVSNALSTYIINPDVSVNVTKLGGVRVYVFGEINKPGAYTLTKSSTVIDAIGAAGSFNWDTAKNILKTGDMSQNYIMREGDILYLTKNSKISFSRDIAPILTGAYMVSRIGKD